jgi:hypothetical protein
MRARLAAAASLLICWIALPGAAAAQPPAPPTPRDPPPLPAAPKPNPPSSPAAPPAQSAPNDAPPADANAPPAGSAAPPADANAPPAGSNAPPADTDAPPPVPAPFDSLASARHKLPPGVDPDDAVEPDDQLRPIGEPETDASQHHYFPLNLSLLYPLATNLGDPNRATNIDLGVLFTKVGYLYGVQTGFLASVSQRMAGLQLGFGAITEGRTEGAQIAGAFAMSDAPFDGLQVAGVFAWSRFRFNGVEIAGVANQARKHFAGLQLAGALNLARKTAHGAQISGFMNLGAIEGLQLGTLNISDRVDGVQIGVINIARKVKGLQIGLINIADDVDGESIGAASVPRTGGIHGVVWGSSSLYGNFGLKFASHYTYSIFTGSFHFEGKDKLVGPGFTFGLFHPFLPSLLDGLYLQADIGFYRMFLTEGEQRKHDEIYKTRLLLRYSLVRHLSLFVGGGAYLGIQGSSPTARWGPELDAGLEL